MLEGEVEEAQEVRNLGFTYSIYVEIDNMEIDGLGIQCQT